MTQYVNTRKSDIKGIYDNMVGRYVTFADATDPDNEHKCLEGVCTGAIVAVRINDDFCAEFTVSWDKPCDLHIWDLTESMLGWDVVRSLDNYDNPGDSYNTYMSHELRLV